MIDPPPAGGGHPSLVRRGSENCAFFETWFRGMFSPNPPAARGGVWDEK